MERLILVKYGEIHLKGLNRPYFKRLLIERLLEALAGFRCQVRETQGRIFVSGFAPEEEAEVAQRCANTFGVVGVCPATKVDKQLEAIARQAIEAVENSKLRSAIQPATFKIQARREDKSFPLNSLELAKEIGGRVLEATSSLSVDVHHPALVIGIEIRDAAYVYDHVIKGVGGMPVGASGKGLVLLSGGIDSPVALYLMAKRGMKMSAVHFMSPPHTGQAAQQKVEDLAAQLSKYCHSIDLHLVHFTQIQERLYAECKPDLLTILMRRSMMRIAMALAKREGDLALVTGESLGQVASQTAEAIVVTDAVADMPVFRPLIGLDKTEIIQYAQHIGTFDISIRPGEDCCTVFVPKHPSTKPSMETVLKEEQKLPLAEMIQQAVDQIQTLTITRD